MEPEQQKVFKLLGKVQHYAWGGTGFLPQFLQILNPGQEPYAEYWMGAHANASSSVEYVNGESRPLDAVIATGPSKILGAKVAGRFGRLPYLLKILDVKDMLSIQVHPSKDNAEKEFAAEQGRGIPLNAGHRNYKDDNHKPELMVALGPFWLLHGFKTPAELREILNRIPELNTLVSVFGENNYRELYKTVMEMPQADVNKLLTPLIDRIVPAYKAGSLNKRNEDFWAARAALTYNTSGNIDRGIFSIYFFNLLNLQEGDAVFQDAGLPHAYLEGQNVEIMANSDNVLRGGLTPKHVDTAELLKHVAFEQTIPKIIHATPPGKRSGAFVTPAIDFELRKLEVKTGDELLMNSVSIEIFVILKGSVEIKEGGHETIRLNHGDAWISFDGASYIITICDDILVYSAAVPVS